MIVCLVDKIMAYEAGKLTEEQEIALFQDLLNSGFVFKLQALC